MNISNSIIPSVLVTGSTGTIGQAVVNALRELGVPAVAGARDLENATRLLGEGVTLRHLDWSDPTTFSGALESIDRVFLLGPPLDPEVEHLLAPFIDELNRRDLGGVTYLSAYGMENLDDLMGFHARIEARIRNLPNWTILRPGFFASNFVNYYGPALESGVLALPCGSGGTAFIDPLDIGACAARVLADCANHSGKIYTLTGPHSQTFAEITAFLSDLLGRAICYEPVTPEAFEQTLQSFGMPPVLCRYMNEVYGLIRNGHVTNVQSGVQELLHREPRSLEDYLGRTLRRGRKVSSQ